MAIKDQNYFTVLGWMRTKLQLKGNDLIIYALVYSFSQDGESEFRGSIDYICEFTGGARETIKRGLAHLEGAGLIAKTSYNKKNGGTNGYKIVPFDVTAGVAQNEPPPCVKMSHGVAQNEPRGGSKRAMILNSYNQDYIKDYKVRTNVSNKDIYKKEKGKEKKADTSFDAAMDEYNLSLSVKTAVSDLIKFRAASKIPTTNAYLSDLCYRLVDCYRNDNERVNALQEAIRMGYPDIREKDY